MLVTTEPSWGEIDAERDRELFTVDETARILKVSSMTVRRHISSGRLAAIRVGRGIRVRRTALDAFVQPVVAPARENEGLDAGNHLTFDGPIWGIVDDDGPTRAAVNHDKYPAEAYADNHGE